MVRKVWHVDSVSVLVVSEDAAWRTHLVALLDADGYAVRSDDRGDAAFGPGCPFDIAVIDLAVTGRSPLALIAALRRRSSIPILAVSPDGLRGAPALPALEAGADQILVRGARSNELLARLRALLRQSPPRRRSGTTTATERVPSINLEVTTGRVTVAGREVRLSPGERDLLQALLARPDAVVTREDLAALRLGMPSEGGLDALVRGTRAKLEAVEGRRRIVAVRGVGFRLVSDAELGAVGPTGP